jgi:hypothetical protein
MTVPSSRTNFTIGQGTTWSVTVTYTDVTGTAIDLTGYSVRAEMKRNFSDSTAAQTITCTLTDAENGVITLSLTAAQTKLLSGDYLYDLEIQSAGGAISRLLNGTITIDKEVTVE